MGRRTCIRIGGGSRLQEVAGCRTCIRIGGGSWLREVVGRQTCIRIGGGSWLWEVAIASFGHSSACTPLLPWVGYRSGPRPSSRAAGPACGACVLGLGTLAAARVIVLLASSAARTRDSACAAEHVWPDRQRWHNSAMWCLVGSPWSSVTTLYLASQGYTSVRQCLHSWWPNHLGVSNARPLPNGAWEKSVTRVIKWRYLVILAIGVRAGPPRIARRTHELGQQRTSLRFVLVEAELRSCFQVALRAPETFVFFNDSVHCPLVLQPKTKLTTSSFTTAILCPFSSVLDKRMSSCKLLNNTTGIFKLLILFNVYNIFHYRHRRLQLENGLPTDEDHYRGSSQQPHARQILSTRLHPPCR